MVMSTQGRSRWLSLSLILLAAACSGRPADQAASPPRRLPAMAAGAAGLQATAASRQAAPVYALVELTQLPSAAQFSAKLARVSFGIGTTADATAAAVSQLATVSAEQGAFAQQVSAAAIPGTTELYRLQRVFNGILYVTDAVGLERLRALPGAHKVHVIVPSELDNAYGVPLVGVPQLWSAGVPLHGDNVNVGVIDTGIDYTHANFGGAGTVAAYNAIDPNVVAPGTFPTTKVVGGHDFAGPTYNANPSSATYQPIPAPDGNPIDKSGHGSHVAGTIAGFGVKADGTTYAGPYDLTLDPTTLRIGPGAAPKASLYALKVFGDGGGSTNLAALAMEWATDPNGDGDFSDHLDVVNLSLGSGFGTSADTEAAIYTNAVKAGVVVVASAGNSSDVFFISGAPGSTPSVISVAATSVGESAGVRVNAPASIAGLKAAGTAAFGPASWTAVTGDVVATVPATACNGAAGSVTNGAAIAGKVALIARGTCSFALKTWAAQQAGAIAVLITNNVAGDPPGMAGVATPDPITIPTRSLTLADGNAINAALLVPDVVNVTIDDSTVFQNPTQIDTVTSFTSRGPTRVRNQAVLKPDVAAPGNNVVSTGMGTGYLGATMSGTSMAAPITTGVMALLKQQHPTWTPAQLKALLMNTAAHDVYNAPTTAPTRYRSGPSRVGAGRIDAAKAFGSPVIAFDKAAPERVTVTFATTDVTAATSETHTVQLQNTGAVSVTYDVAIDPVRAPPGVTVTAGAATVTVPAGGTAELTLRLDADPATMFRLRDPTVSTGGGARDWLSEAAGYLLLQQAGATVLRVPYYGAPRPASAMHAAGSLTTRLRPSGTSTLALAGTGVNNVTASEGDVLSVVTPFELAYASPKAPPVGSWLPYGYDPAETDNANLRYVGVTSNFPDVGNLATAELYFAVNTWGLWGSPSDVEFDVYIRKVGAPGWEYVLYNTDRGRALGGSSNDIPFTVLVNLGTGGGSLEDFVNGVAPVQLNVPLFLSDSMVLPVTTAGLGLDTALSSAIEFQVVSFSPSSGAPISQTPVLTYDPQATAISSGIDPSLTALGAGYTPFWTDLNGKTLPISYNLDAARANDTHGILLLHHHNAFGQRAETVAIDGLTCTSDAACAGFPTKPVCDIGSGACVGCVTNGDCVGAGAYCDATGTRTCVTPDCRLVGAPACPVHFTCGADYGACLPNQELVLVTGTPSGPNCAAGGQQIATGFDDNRNGVLDASEVISTSYVCNGVTGPAGASGPKGSSGCSSAGGGASAFSLLGLGALLWRRRRTVKTTSAR